MSVTRESLDPPVGIDDVADVMLMSAGPHLSARNRDDDVSMPRGLVTACVAPGFKDKTRYTLYVSPGSQFSHIATNKGNIKRQYLLHNVLVKGK